MRDNVATVEVRNVAGRFTLTLHGEFDIATVSVLDQAFRDVNGRAPTHVSVDLRDTAFFGLTALDQVLAADANLATRGCGLDVVHPTPSVEKMLAVLDAEHLLAACGPSPLGDRQREDVRVSAPQTPRPPPPESSSPAVPETPCLRRPPAR